jgi:hypothetical protein
MTTLALLQAGAVDLIPLPAASQSGTGCVPRSADQRVNMEWRVCRGLKRVAHPPASEVGEYKTLAACFDWVSAPAFLVDRDGG